MRKEIIKTQMHVKDNSVEVIKVGNVDYISITDLARFKKPLNPGDALSNG